MSGQEDHPGPALEEGRVFLRQKARTLREELRQEETFNINLTIASTPDAQRMTEELNRVALQLATEEIDLARSGFSESFVRNQIARRKFTLLRELGPGRCQSCGNEGQEEDKMVRTSKTCGELRDQQHWHHESCLRQLFLEAINDEEKLPPKCCENAINESYGFNLLSRHDRQAYKHKREEKATVNPTYCPTCSYFISARVIERAIDARVNALKQLKRMPIGHISGSFNCPRCKVSVCLLCKKIEHPGEDCPES
ncbi:MAG: hypothetical protein LQ346_008659 [Caloplaca aetnensis]|nr:MAG: hypothetical protein LQ346_008659 [Caloplaca aetnensis]